MRNDVGKLLSKLGRKEFRYREFADQSGDAELWPIFEALLEDERIVGRRRDRLQARRFKDTAVRHSAGPSQVSQNPSGRRKSPETDALLRRLRS